MEVTKMGNMLEHEDAIMARPARTWFQTERQKRDTAKAAKSASGAPSSEQAAPKTAAERKSEKRAALKQAREAEAKATKRAALDAETRPFLRSIKASKSKMRALTQSGLSSAAARAAAVANAGGAGDGEGKKKRKKAAAPASGGGGGPGGGDLFSGDGLVTAGSGGAKPGAGLSSSGKPLRSSRERVSKSELNKVKRGGHGVHGFKSKAKYKRR
jgi:ATP-dependent RNA helicase DDX27